MESNNHNNAHKPMSLIERIRIHDNLSLHIAACGIEAVMEAFERELLMISVR